MAKNQQARPVLGMEVVDDSGHFVGTVETVERDHFVVQKGFIFPKDQRIPNSAIGEINEMELRLRASRESAMHEPADVNWADRPENDEIVPNTDDEE